MSKPLELISHAIDQIILSANSIPDEDTRESIRTECADMLLAVKDMEHQAELRLAFDSAKSLLSKEIDIDLGDPC